MLLALLLATAPALDPERGVSGVFENELPEARRQTRIRLAIGGSVALEGSADIFAGGPGVRAELGVQLEDQIALSVEASGNTSVTSLGFGGGLAFDAALGERFFLGLGARFTYFTPIFNSNGPFAGFLFPLRLGFMPTARAPTVVAREGLVFLLSAGPGVNLTPHYSYGCYDCSSSSPLSFVADLSVLWSAW